MLHVQHRQEFQIKTKRKKEENSLIHRFHYSDPEPEQVKHSGACFLNILSICIAVAT